MHSLAFRQHKTNVPLVAKEPCSYIFFDFLKLLVGKNPTDFIIIYWLDY